LKEQSNVWRVLPYTSYQSLRSIALDRFYSIIKVLFLEGRVARRELLLDWLPPERTLCCHSLVLFVINIL
jgi:hypothetical protein